MTLSDVQAAFLEQIDIDESYRFAKELEQFKSNPALGYRTAGSQAEFDAGEHIRSRMLEIGLTDVKKDAFTPVSYTHLRAHETGRNLVCRLLLEKKKKEKKKKSSGVEKQKHHDKQK